jgi:hypothetical protein
MLGRVLRRWFQFPTQQLKVLGLQAPELAQVYNYVVPEPQVIGVDEGRWKHDYHASTNPFQLIWLCFVHGAY